MIEKLFAGNPNEMIGIYHLDMGHRNMDHYGRLGRDQGGETDPAHQTSNTVRSGERTTSRA